MTFKNLAINITKDICEKLGKNNKPEYAVVAIALFKGILRPTFTMHDKKQDPETKKYAAIREGLTEALAIPSYIIMSNLAEKGIAMVLKKKPEEIPKEIKSAKFLGVAVTALLVIPALCNVCLKPIMNLIQKSSNKKQPVNNDEIDPIFLDSFAKPMIFTSINTIDKTSPYSKLPVMQAFVGNSSRTRVGM